MKQYIITHEQRALILECLGNVAAKLSYQSIQTLLTIPEYVTHLEVPEEPVAE